MFTPHPHRAARPRTGVAVVHSVVIIFMCRLLSKTRHSVSCTPGCCMQGCAGQHSCQLCATVNVHTGRAPAHSFQQLCRAGHACQTATACSASLLAHHQLPVQHALATQVVPPSNAKGMHRWMDGCIWGQVAEMHVHGHSVCKAGSSHCRALFGPSNNPIQHCKACVATSPLACLMRRVDTQHSNANLVETSTAIAAVCGGAWRPTTHRDKSTHA
jgi:hypothetical protein